MEKESNVIEHLKKEESVHQKLMNKAYELWSTEKGKNLNYSNFLDLVMDTYGDLYFYSVITGNLNYQVENGGFSQWHFNEYSITLEDLINFFEINFKNNKTIEKVKIILNDISELIDWFDRGRSIIKNIDYEFRDFFSDKLEEQLNDDLNNIDQKYYEINENLNEVLEEYFKTEYEKISTEIREENT